ncbi:MAG: PQQ-dependent sugar dehydrogenase [Betaproteobacteria bacterium]
MKLSYPKRALPLSLTLATAAIALAWVSHDAMALSTDLVESGFVNPIFLTAPDGDSRLFVAERSGTIKVRDNGVWSTFLNIQTIVDSNLTTERGLLGLAFDPGFANKASAGYGTFYVDYIDKATANTHIDKFTVSAGNRNIANPTGINLLSVNQTQGVNKENFGNHKAGWIAFSPNNPNDLYIATGDGGSGNDPYNNGQNTNSLLGKILRIDVHPTDPAAKYAIPSSNPFAAGGGAPEVWDYGVRNPFRNSFDRQTGDLYIADVGQGAREEINFESASSPGGVNYGWNLREGTIETPGVGGPKPPGEQDPAYEYGHGSTPPAFDGNVVTGGYVYRGSFLQGVQGTYFFADFGSGRIWSLRIDPATGELVPGSLVDRTAELGGIDKIGNISSFGEDGFGNLYIVDYNGKVFAIVPEPSTFALVAVGLAGLLWSRHKRNANARMSAVPA